MDKFKSLSDYFSPEEFLTDEQQLKLMGGIEDKRRRPGANPKGLRMSVRLLEQTNKRRSN
jgi:hypothetical protein